MLIISRIYLFVNWLVVSAILIVIGLMVLRLIANAVDLNPFAWPARTIRSLTDPLIGPVRRGLMGFGVDPKYAPLVSILLAVLLGWFLIQLLAGIANTIAGMLISTQAAEPVRLLGYLLYGVLGIYSLLIFIRIIFSWGMVGYGNRVMRFLVNTTEPLLGPLRRIIPPLGMMDISPIVAFIVIWLFQAAIYGTLLRGAPVQFLP
jgi:YggT family protein